VLVTGDLLSLGTSIVNMVSTDGDTLDMNGYASAMYDGLEGLYVRDPHQRRHGMGPVKGDVPPDKKDYAPADESAEEYGGREIPAVLAAQNESFPPSGVIDITRTGNYLPGLGTDYGALIETTLAAVYHYSKGFTRKTSEALYVTGGARRSREILRRIAAVWNRPVIPIEAGGAALGAAVAVPAVSLNRENEPVDISDLHQQRPVKKQGI